MSGSYTKFALRIRNFGLLQPKQRALAALNVTNVVRHADGPKNKRGLYYALRQSGRAEGFVHSRNAAELEELMDLAGVTVQMRRGRSFNTNHGGRPFGSDEWH